MLPQVVATPHIAASTREGQELVGVETAAALRDFLKDGIIRNAVNFPSVSPRSSSGCSRSPLLGERLGTFIAQMNDARATEVSLRYYGELAQSKTGVIVNARPGRLVQADPLDRRHRRQRAPASPPSAASRSSNRTAPAPRNYTSLISVKLRPPRRTLGRRRRLRARRAAPGPARRHRRRSAARRDDDRDLQHDQPGVIGESARSSASTE